MLRDLFILVLTIAFVGLSAVFTYVYLWLLPEPAANLLSVFTMLALVAGIARCAK